MPLFEYDFLQRALVAAALIPLGQAWLRIEADTGGRLLGSLIPDARVQRIYGGTSEIMKEIIARSL